LAVAWFIPKTEHRSNQVVYAQRREAKPLTKIHGWIPAQNWTSCSMTHGATNERTTRTRERRGEARPLHYIAKLTGNTGALTAEMMVMLPEKTWFRANGAGAESYKRCH